MTPHRPTLQLAVNALLHRALAVQQALQVPVQLGSTEIVPLCAIGIGRWPLDGDQPPALLEAAQAARHDTAPGGTPAFFRPETKARALRAMQIEAVLGQALQTGEFELHYPSKVDLGSGALERRPVQAQSAAIAGYGEHLQRRLGVFGRDERA